MNEKNSNRLVLQYDTAFAPLSFDFVFSLAICRALSEKNGLSPQFDVEIISQSFRDVGIESNYSNDYREKKLKDVIINTALMCKWVNSVSIIRGDSLLPDYDHLRIPSKEMVARRGQIPEWQITPMVPKQLTETIRGGGTITDHGFRASETIRKRFEMIGKDCVIIHPRCSIHGKERNSNRQLAEEATFKLNRAGFRVFFVPDIDDIREGYTWHDFPAEPIIEASFDFESRLAVAENCATNLLWSSGIALPLFFSPAHFLFIGALNKLSPISTPDFFNRKGPVIGQQPDWLNFPHQKFDWTHTHELTAEYVHKELLGTI